MFDIKELVKNQRNFFLTGQSKGTTFRIRNLKKLKLALESYEDSLILSLREDLNKSAFESQMSEISFVYEEISLAIKNLDSWMKKEKVATPMEAMPAKSYHVYEPLGVSLIISPWNYPILLSLVPLVSSIAAGNTTILKLSKKSKNVTQTIKKMLDENFDEDFIKVVDNDLVSHDDLLNERYDHIFFTGSSGVGKEVMKKASENLTKVTLELGGKSPCIVDESADLKLSAKRIVWGKFLNAGQTCIAPDYLLVQKDVKNELVNYLKEAIIEFWGANPLINPDYPKIIDQKAFYRLTGLLQNQEIIIGGEYDQKSLKIEPSLVDNVGFSNKLMDNEIFGPILPILKFDDIFTLINKLKTLEKPLALYLFSQDESHIASIMNDLSFGNGCINDTVTQIASSYLEFGGVGNSGLGGYHGKYGFMDFSNRKSIMERSLNFDVDLRYPPYSKKKLSVLRLIGKKSK